MLKSALSASTSILLLVASQQPVAAQHLLASANSLTSQEKVDSLFKTNFLSIKQKLSIHQHLASSESDFIYIISFMSGIDFNLESYSGEPLLTPQKLHHFRSWYKSYKSKIEWGKYQSGVHWLHAPLYLSPHDNDALTKNESLLYSLRIR